MALHTTAFHAHAACLRGRARAREAKRRLAGVISSPSDFQTSPKPHAVYLTNVSLLFQCSFLVLSTRATHLASLPGASSNAPTWLRHLLSLHALTLPASILVTALFWLLVYPSWHASANYPSALSSKDFFFFCFSAPNLF